MSTEQEINSKDSGVDTVTALRKELEHVLSKESLQADTILVSQMNASLFVPISVVAQLESIRKISSNPEEIREAGRSSDQVVLSDDGSMIKPNIQAKRNTIILREVPSNTPKEELLALFRDINGEDPEKIRSDVGDTWFVTVKDEETARNTLRALLTRKFKDSRIKARLKSENLLRTILPNGAPDAGSAPTAQSGRASFGSGGFSGASMPGMQGFGNFNPQIPFGSFNPAAFMGALGGGGGGMMPFGGFGAGGFGVTDPSSSGSKKSGRFGNKGGQTSSSSSSSSNSAKGGAQAAGGGAVPSADEMMALMAGAAQSGDAPPSVSIPPMGYSRDFQKYRADQILHIIKMMPQDMYDRPPAMSLERHGLVVSAKLNKDLVGKQRTESMEQALRHGRPRFDSDASINSMDYRSMMFGDTGRTGSRTASMGSHADLRASMDSTGARKGSIADHAASGKQSAHQGHQQHKKQQPQAAAPAAGEDVGSAGNEAQGAATSKGNGVHGKPPSGGYAAALLRKADNPNATAASSQQQQQQQLKKKSSPQEVQQAPKSAKKGKNKGKQQHPSQHDNVQRPRANSKNGKAGNVSAPSASTAAASEPRNTNESAESNEGRTNAASAPVPNQAAPPSHPSHPSGTSGLPGPASPARPRRGWEKPGIAPVKPQTPKVPAQQQAQGQHNSDASAAPAGDSAKASKAPRGSGSGSGRGRRRSGGDGEKHRGNAAAGKGNSHGRGGRTASSSSAANARPPAPQGPANTGGGSTVQSPRPAWGGKTTFAEIVRKPLDATAASASPRTAVKVTGGKGASSTAMNGNTDDEPMEVREFLSKEERQEALARRQQRENERRRHQPRQ